MQCPGLKVADGRHGVPNVIEENRPKNASRRGLLAVISFVVWIYAITYYANVVAPPTGIVDALTFATILLSTAVWLTFSRLWGALQSLSVLALAEAVVAFVAFVVGGYCFGLAAPNSGAAGLFLRALQNPTAYSFFISNVVAAPIVEELAFRGYLIGRLRTLYQRPGWALAVILASAISFAAVHYFEYRTGSPADLARDMLGLFISGGVYAICYFETNNLVIAIMTHAYYNFAASYAATGVLSDAVALGIAMPLVITVIHDFARTAETRARRPGL